MTKREQIIEVMARAIMSAEDDYSEKTLDMFFGATEHNGDCTKQCHTCLVCYADDFRQQAEAALTALESSGYIVRPREATERMVDGVPLVILGNGMSHNEAVTTIDTAMTLAWEQEQNDE